MAFHILPAIMLRAVERDAERTQRVSASSGSVIGLTAILPFRKQLVFTLTTLRADLSSSFLSIFALFGGMVQATFGGRPTAASFPSMFLWGCFPLVFAYRSCDISCVTAVEVPCVEPVECLQANWKTSTASSASSWDSLCHFSSALWKST